MPRLTRITIYPIKSFDGLELASAEILPGGALQHDRRWALVDAWGQFVNGKRCQTIHQIRAVFSEDCRQVTLRDADREATFFLNDEPAAIAAWCGAILGQKCRLVENAEVGFPDDCEAPGPTLISTATLEVVSAWFAGLSLEETGLSLEETRRRFRANLEIDAGEPFWEDRLVGERTKIRRFRIGDTVWQGRGVCERCVVPTRDSHSGAARPGFARQFSELREAALPDWSPVERFDHFYRVAITTGLDSIPGEPLLRVGDSVEAIEDTRLASHQ